MNETLTAERRWSADGAALLAPDMHPHMISIFGRAVAEYGPEHWGNGWSVGGVVFSGENPSVRGLPDQPVSIIALPMAGAEDMNIALAFLAHELVHCLCLGKDEHAAPMIEEGAAVRFSIMEAARRDTTFAVMLWSHQTTAPGSEHYAEALFAVERLLKIEPDAIRRLRTENPDWSAITAERILAVAPTCPPDLAAGLAEVREMRLDDDHAVALAQAAEREGKA